MSQTPEYWLSVITAIDDKIETAKAELAALAGKRNPLVLSAHLGDESASTKITEIDQEVARLNASLPDLVVATAQAEKCLRDAQQAAKRDADKARATELIGLCEARSDLMQRLDVAASNFVDLLVEDIQQRETFGGISGVQFRGYNELSLVKSVLSFELLNKRNVTPSRHELHLTVEHHTSRTSAADSVWGAGWIEPVMHKARELSGESLTAGESVAVAAIAGE